MISPKLTNVSGMQSNVTAHYAALDAMRGIAAVMVVLNHVGSAWGGCGYLAVDLFFLMSGFVVARAYEPKLNNTLSIIGFLKIRVMRLYPALALGVLISIVCAHFNPSITPTWGMVLKSLTLVPSLEHNALFPLNNVLWSLFFELVINTAHAAIARWLTIRRLSIIIVFSGIAFLAVIIRFHTAAVGTNSTSFYAGFARVAWSYFAGVLIARYRPSARISSRWSGTAVLLVTTLLLLPGPGIAAITALRVMATIFLLFPLCVYLVVAARPVVTGRRLCETLGGLSYPLYTIHYPLVGLTAMAIRHGRASDTIWFVVLPAILLLAYLVEQFYDAPIRGWLRERYRRSTTAASIAAR